jgi:hypothetical protein
VQTASAVVISLGRKVMNLETVKQIYAAFGRGDIPAILEP